MHFVQAQTAQEWEAVKYFRHTYFFGPNGIEDPNLSTFGHPEHAHLILYEGMNRIGYAHMQFWPNQQTAMWIIVIEENHRNQNAGSAFLTLIEDWLKNLGIKSIHLLSRQSALKFYRKNGYVELPFNDPEPHEIDPNDVPLGKILT